MCVRIKQKVKRLLMFRFPEALFRAWVHNNTDRPAGVFTDKKNVVS